MDTLRFLLAVLALAAATAHAGRLADVHIHDRALGTELPVHWHGKAYVVGHPGNEYEVVIRNRTGEDLLAVVSVDGVNVVSGETASTRQGGYIVGPWSSVRIAGWRKSLSETAAFYFTSLPDSYAARTDRPGNVGVIGVALFQRRVQIATPLNVQPVPRSEASARDPAAESRARPPAAVQSPSLGTGHGRRESSPVEMVEFERRTRSPAEIIAIHYDSRANLVALGVLPAPPLARHSPDPFPARFVPDP